MFITIICPSSPSLIMTGNFPRLDINNVQISIFISSQEKLNFPKSAWLKPTILLLYQSITYFCSFNPVLSGGRDLNPRPSPCEGDILPLNDHRMAGGGRMHTAIVLIPHMSYELVRF